MTDLIWPEDWPGPRPVEPGAYFYREMGKDGVPEHRQLFDVRKDIRTGTLSTNGYSLLNYPGQFCGPIPHPREPGEKEQG